MLNAAHARSTRRTTAPLFPYARSGSFPGIRTFLLPQPEEARPVPVRSGDETRDLGETGVCLPRIRIAALDHDHAMDRARPSPDELGAGLDPALTQRAQHRGRIPRLGQAVEQALARPVETAEGLDLQLMGQGPEQEIALEAGGRRPPHLPPPLRPQLFEAKIAQPRDLSFDPGEIGHRLSLPAQ